MCPEPGELAGEWTDIVASQLDTDPSVRRGGTDRGPTPENPTQGPDDFGARRRPDPQPRATLIDLVGDQSPRFVKIEPRVADHIVPGAAGLGHPVGPERPQPA